MDTDVACAGSAVRFMFTWQEGRVTDITTDSPPINHFLDLLQLSRAYNTWVSYGHGLKVFFSIVQKPPEEVTRADCLAFMRDQEQSGLASLLHFFASSICRVGGANESRCALVPDPSING